MGWKTFANRKQPRTHTRTRLTQTRGNIDLSQITRFINNTFLWSRNLLYLFRIYILEAKKLIIKFGKQIVVVLPLFYIAAPSAWMERQYSNTKVPVPVLQFCIQFNRQYVPYSYYYVPVTGSSYRGSGMGWSTRNIKLRYCYGQVAIAETMNLQLF